MRAKFLAAFLFVLFTVPALAQLQSILIPAGTPEDEAIQEISKESDESKRVALWQEFVTKFSGNKAAFAYGNSQIAQHYLDRGDAEKALAYGDKAMAAVPNNSGILMSQTMAAQQLKDNAKVLQYATAAGRAINGIKKAPQPENIGEAEWAATLEDQRQRVSQQYEFFENACYNAIAAEQDSKKRIASAQTYTEAFPDGKYADSVHQLAIEAFLQARDFSGLSRYGEKALAANPNNVGTLALLSYALAEDPNPKNPYLLRAVEHARKAIDLAKVTPDSDRSLKLSAGLAHAALGYALMKEEKTAASIVEFKTAAGLLKDEPGSYEEAMFRLGYAYAKLKRTAEARDTLNEVIALKGAREKSARDVLAKMSAGKAQ